MMKMIEIRFYMEALGLLIAHWLCLRNRDLNNLRILVLKGAVSRFLGLVVGGTIEIDEKDLLVYRKFISIRVLIHLTKPLRRDAMITLEGKKLWVEFRYEQLPNFCCTCGRLVNAEINCEDEDAKKYGSEYGDWMCASPIKNIVDRSATETEKERVLLREIRGDKDNLSDEEEKGGRVEEAKIP